MYLTVFKMLYVFELVKFTKGSSIEIILKSMSMSFHPHYHTSKINIY